MQHQQTYKTIAECNKCGTWKGYKAGDNLICSCGNQQVKKPNKNEGFTIWNVSVCI